MAVTTTVCDDRRHNECPGTGLIQGILKPPHEPDALGEQVWVTTNCGCPCHGTTCRNWLGDIGLCAAEQGHRGMCIEQPENLPEHDPACNIAGCLPSCKRGRVETLRRVYGCPVLPPEVEAEARAHEVKGNVEIANGHGTGRKHFRIADAIRADAGRRAGRLT